MCGRFTIKTPKDVLSAEFGVDIPQQLDIRPRYNVSPTQVVPVIANRAPTESGRRTLELFRWGLIPLWAKDPKIGNKLVNARGESLAQKPSFKSAFKKRRCLVLADGFYEWKADPSGKGKIPLHVRMKGGKPFTFGALWETWKSPEGELVHSCCLITTSPNELCATFHDRMPVIIPPDRRERWLAPEAVEPAALQDLVAPYPAAEMEAYEVSKLVNNAKNEKPECIERLAADSAAG